MISLKNLNNKVKLRRAFVGEGFRQYFFLRTPAPMQPNRWESRTTLLGETPVQWSSSEIDSHGESVQITMGERRPLFPCSGFVRGDLQGTIRAPALRLEGMDEEIWAFLLYFEADGRQACSLRSEKDSLAVSHGSTSATATITTVEGSPPGVLASLTSEGADFKTATLVLDRAIGKGSLQDSMQQELAVLTPGQDGYKEASWATIDRADLEVLWIFSKSHSEKGHLKDLLATLGAKVSRSPFASFGDYAGGKEMEDFVIRDDPTMLYQIGLMLDCAGADSVTDWAELKFVETTRQIESGPADETRGWSLPDI